MPCKTSNARWLPAVRHLGQKETALCASFFSDEYDFHREFPSGFTKHWPKAHRASSNSLLQLMEEPRRSRILLVATTNVEELSRRRVV